MLIMAVMSFVGIISLPLLNIQYKPSKTGKTLSVTFSYPDASPETIESEVTSKIEGIMAKLSGCTDISSLSSHGYGEVTASLDKHRNLAAARLELASEIRNIYTSLPYGVSYPAISHNAKGESNTASISYQLIGDRPTTEIEQYAEDNILQELSTIKGVEKIMLHGATPHQWEITFNAPVAASLGINAPDIATAISNTFSEDLIGLFSNSHETVSVRLSGNRYRDFGQIPIKKSGNRIIYIQDIAQWEYQQQQPQSYLRVNGLNTVVLTVAISGNTNLLTASKDIRNKMDELQGQFPEWISPVLAYDPAEFVSQELKSIYVRTGLCILILLAFVLLLKRSWKYTFIIALTLTVNTLVSLAIYAFTGISIHIYTLAGITVSLGIVIDTSIIMTDHYANFRDRKAFFSILAATCTTIAALLMVLLLPENERLNLIDFILVISINLAVSLIVAWLFIPALMDLMNTGPGNDVSKVDSPQKIRFYNAYGKYIHWGVRHRWIYVVIFILAFGIPLCLLPSPSKTSGKTEYWKPYEKHKSTIDKIASSSFGLFYRALGRANFYREPQKPMLRIHAGMPEGCSVHQLNEIIIKVEDYLSEFDQIKVFKSEVRSYSDAYITIEFKPEYEKASFPLELKSAVIDMVRNYGGIQWSVIGIDDTPYSNGGNTLNVFSGISLSGYNYDELARYAEHLATCLSQNRRVLDVEIWGSLEEGSPRDEFNMKYDAEKLAIAGMTVQEHHQKLATYLYDSEVSDIVLRSSEHDTYDYWHIKHTPVTGQDGTIAFGNVGSLEKLKSGISIHKKNQSYELHVNFGFIGSKTLYNRFLKETISYMNDSVLPVGYKAFDPNDSLWESGKERYAWIIALIIAVIFVMLSIFFESVRLPLAVMFSVPISFIGVFLAIGLSDINFDQGGFAAFIMLCGIVVNAGIYITLTYTDLHKNKAEDPVKRYMEAFRRKINPILLTVVSTVLGLIPFLTEGPDEVFWFCFAICTISGITFSLIAIYLVLPAFVIRKNDLKSIDTI